jgi:hypothetical protein
MYPPQGNQPPSNQPPYGAPPAGYVPPNQRQPSKGGCWMWGGIGCLVLIILVIAAGAIGFYQLKHSKQGQAMMGGFNSAMNTGQEIADNAAKMKLIHDALVKYKTDNGNYPASLTDLVPKYLVAVSALHTSSDPNTDPNHVSFTYTQPPADASGETPLVSSHVVTTMNIMGSTAKIDDKMTYMVNGRMAQDQTTTSTTPDGKTSTSTTHSETGTGT